MANEQDRKPATDTEADISKAQASQQPAGQQIQPPESAERADQTGDQPTTGQAQQGAGPDEGLQGETATQQRTDIEGASLNEETAEGGFVGSQSDADSSSELVEDEDFAKDGQGAPEGK